MGSCTLVGMVFNYYIERFDEENIKGETVTTYKASAQWGDMKTFFSYTLDELIRNITKEVFNESPYYKEEILQFFEELKGAK